MVEAIAGSDALDYPSECKECGSKGPFSRDGHKYIDGISVQRWLCKKCSLRFTLGHSTSRTNADHYRGSQISAILKEAKNLTSPTETKTVVEPQKGQNPEAQIVSFLISQKNNGRRESTIQQRNEQLNRLRRKGADLNDPESVKRVIANIECTEGYKALLCFTYQGFAEKNGIQWEKPNYKQQHTLPFCPHETELDVLTAACPKKTATIMKLLKETAMRIGEAWQVEWSDFDVVNRTLICKNPEKNSRSRAFNDLSPELCQMLASLPHNSQYIFTCSKKPLIHQDRKEHMQRLESQKVLLRPVKTRLALKLQNPRIAKITYCSVRHWKATQLYHQTKDILYVMKFLGHRSILNTLMYIDLEKLAYPHGGNDYHCKIAKTEVEALQLIEAGFDFVCSMGEAKFFRKRK